jgi:threonine dehydrogenase-like Zn-dependent dehydrogenase
MQLCSVAARWAGVSATAPHTPDGLGVSAEIVARCAVLRGRSSVELGEVRLGLDTGDVLLAVDSCGICATNVHAWRQGSAAGQGVPGAGGHELSATVEILAPDTHGPPVGSRVCVEPNLAVACGSCDACSAGAPFHCSHQKRLQTWGFSERMVVPASAVLPIPSGLDPVLATLAEPLACAVGGLRTSRLAELNDGRLGGARVAVVGAGALGLLTVFAARRLGAGDVLSLARHRHQAELAAAMGATEVVAAGERAFETLRAAKPAVVVVAAGGADQLLDHSLRAISSRGEVVVLGVLEAPQAIDARRALWRSARLVFAISHGISQARSDFGTALALLEQAPALAALITHRFPLQRVDEAFATASTREGGAVRVLVEPRLG